jgi:hypothetical protein
MGGSDQEIKTIIDALKQRMDAIHQNVRDIYTVTPACPDGMRICESDMCPDENSINPRVFNTNGDQCFPDAAFEPENLVSQFNVNKREALRLIALGLNKIRNQCETYTTDTQCNSNDKCVWDNSKCQLKHSFENDEVQFLRTIAPKIEQLKNVDVKVNTINDKSTLIRVFKEKLIPFYESVNLIDNNDIKKFRNEPLWYKKMIIIFDALVKNKQWGPDDEPYVNNYKNIRNDLEKINYFFSHIVGYIDS